jgi:L-amino acid N-acyltransferase YncA
MHPSIRPATPADGAALAAIYNPYVADTIITFEEEPVSAEEMAARVAKVSLGFPYLVWEEDGRVLGYAYASTWRTRHAYRFSAETSVYVQAGQHHRGIGIALYRALLEAMRGRGFHSAIGCLALPNGPSVALHEKLGFTKAGHMREAGLKFGAWVDVGFWELLL